MSIHNIKQIDRSDIVIISPVRIIGINFKKAIFLSFEELVRTLFPLEPNLFQTTLYKEKSCPLLTGSFSSYSLASSQKHLENNIKQSDFEEILISYGLPELIFAQMNLELLQKKFVQNYPKFKFIIFSYHLFSDEFKQIVSFLSDHLAIYIVNLSDYLPLPIKQSEHLIFIGKTDLCDLYEMSCLEQGINVIRELDTSVTNCLSYTLLVSLKRFLTQHTEHDAITILSLLLPNSFRSKSRHLQKMACAMVNYFELGHSDYNFPEEVEWLIDLVKIRNSATESQANYLVYFTNLCQGVCHSRKGVYENYLLQLGQTSLPFELQQTKTLELVSDKNINLVRSKNAYIHTAEQIDDYPVMVRNVHVIKGNYY